jgi:DNA-binding response OmpR family regulator
LAPLDESRPPIDIGLLHVEPEIQEITWQGRFIRLTPTEFRILHLLAIHVGRVVTTTRLLAFVWGYEGGDPSALRTHISHLRTKLQTDTLQTRITGLSGVGYRFEIVGDSLSEVGARPVLGNARLTGATS